jgi:type II secretory pathway pseudopilin PulG
MNNSRFKIQDLIKAPRDSRCCAPHSVLHIPHFPNGFTYVALLVAIIIIGISLGAAGKYWSNVMKREREEELLFRGDQYRLAIERYYMANCPKSVGPCPQSILPQGIENLLSDDRFPRAKRHLRQQYKDPMTGQDFELIRDQLVGNRITGVYSSSTQTAIRTTGFPDPYQPFEGKTSYSEWKFAYIPPQGQAPRTGTPVRPGSPSLLK